MPSMCAPDRSETGKHGRLSELGLRVTNFLAFDVMKQRKADMAYRSRAHRHPAHSPHTRRPPRAPHPGRERGE